MKILNLEDVKKRVIKELKFDEWTLQQENQDNVSKHHYYITLLAEEEEKLFDLRQLKEKLFSELFKFYKWGESKVIYPEKTFEKTVIGKDIETLIIADEQWQKFMKTYNKQKSIVEYLEKVEKLFSNRYYSLNNAVKLYKKEHMGE